MVPDGIHARFRACILPPAPEQRPCGRIEEPKSRATFLRRDDYLVQILGNDRQRKTMEIEPAPLSVNSLFMRCMSHWSV